MMRMMVGPNSLYFVRVVVVEKTGKDKGSI